MWECPAPPAAGNIKSSRHVRDLHQLCKSGIALVFPKNLPPGLIWNGTVLCMEILGGVGEYMDFVLQVVSIQQEVQRLTQAAAASTGAE
jgi:hypothetical protein